MSRKARFIGFALSSITLSSLASMPSTDAKPWTQWVQQGGNIIRRAKQLHDQNSGGSYGGGGGGYEPPPTPPSSHESGSPGAGFYNISPDTMRNPLRHEEAPQPAYSPPPSTPSYSSPSSRSAYHSGAGSVSDNPNVRMPSYVQAHAVKNHARVAPPKHAEHVPEKTASVVVKKDPVLTNVVKTDDLKPATGFDTSWVTHSVDRIENRLRAPQG